MSKNYERYPMPTQENPAYDWDILADDELYLKLQPSPLEMAKAGLENAVNIAKFSHRVAKAAPAIGSEVFRHIRFELGI